MQHDEQNGYLANWDEGVRKYEQQKREKELRDAKDTNKMQNLMINKTSFGEVEKINSHFHYDEYVLKHNKEHFDYFLDKNLDLKEKNIVLQYRDDLLMFKGIITGFNEVEGIWYININRTSDIEEIRIIK